MLGSYLFLESVIGSKHCVLLPTVSLPFPSPSSSSSPGMKGRRGKGERQCEGMGTLNPHSVSGFKVHPSTLGLNLQFLGSPEPQELDGESMGR